MEDRDPPGEETLRALEFLEVDTRPQGQAINDVPLLPGRVVRLLASKLAISDLNVLALLRITEAAYRKTQVRQEFLTSAQSARALRVARVAALAVQVFERSEKAARWLATEHLVLGRRPLDMLISDAGAREVEEELRRIAWCDFA